MFKVILIIQELYGENFKDVLYRLDAVTEIDDTLPILEEYTKQLQSFIARCKANKRVID